MISQVFSSKNDEYFVPYFALFCSTLLLAIESLWRCMALIVLLHLMAIELYMKIHGRSSVLERLSWLWCSLGCLGYSKYDHYGRSPIISNSDSLVSV